MTSAQEHSVSTRMEPLPWQHTLWQTLDERFRGGRFPHAMLITGTVGVGKAVLARAFAARMVCESPITMETGGAQRACGRCKQCELVNGEGHPDIRLVAPEGAKVIKVDQVRDLITFAHKSPQVARSKVVVLDTADQLNVSAANALLKTLEEPVQNTFLLLLHRAGRPLLPTIRSRCQLVRMEQPSMAESQAWLAANCEADTESSIAALAWAGGAPLAAKAILEDERLGQRNACLEALQQVLKGKSDVATAAKPFLKMTLEDALDLLLLWAHDLVRASVSQDAVRDRTAAAMLGYLAKKQAPAVLHQVYQSTLESRQGMTYNLNPEMELMVLLDQWRQLMRPPGGGKAALRG